MSESPDIRGLQQTDRALRNLRRAALASVEIGTASYDVLPEVLEGAERDRVWREVVLVRAPEVVKYERKAGRVIPVALLRPTGVIPPA